MPDSPLKVVGFAGSLRRASLNRLLLGAAIRLAPEGMSIEELDIREIPLYNGDLDGEDAPQAVLDLKQAVGDADGLLIVTPEYNWGLPAVTKNVIDWASRQQSPPGNVLIDKPVDIMSISAGLGIGAYTRGQARAVLISPRGVPMPYGDVGVSGGMANFDEEGNLVNEGVRDRVIENLTAFADWIRRVSSNGA